MGRRSQSDKAGSLAQTNEAAFHLAGRAVTVWVPGCSWEEADGFFTAPPRMEVSEQSAGEDLQVLV